VAEILAKVELVRLLIDHPPEEFAIKAIYQGRNRLSTRIRTFIDLLAERFSEHRKWMTGGASI
jgi:DNA-binding transcriptional LysR family regulator